MNTVEIYLDLGKCFTIVYANAIRLGSENDNTCHSEIASEETGGVRKFMRKNRKGQTQPSVRQNTSASLPSPLAT